MPLKQVFAVDISKDKIHIHHAFVTQDLKVHHKASKSLPNNLTGFEEFLKWAQARELPQVKVQFIMEFSGVYHEQLAWFLSDRKLEVILVVPRRANSYAKSLSIKSKTDKLDARKLARMGLTQQLEVWQAPDKDILILRQLTRERKRLVIQRARLSNNLEALENSAHDFDFTRRRITQQLELIETQINEIEADMHAKVEANPDLKDYVFRVSAIKGLKELTIVTILAETYGFSTVRNQKQLASYAGLDVKQSESGTMRKQPRISRRGNQHIRTALYFPAMTASRFEPHLKAFYQRIISGTPYKKKGIVAVARKLLSLMYTLWKTGEIYERKIVSNN